MGRGIGETPAFFHTGHIQENLEDELVQEALKKVLMQTDDP